MSRDNKELVWVEKEFAVKYQELESDKSKNEERIKCFEEYMDKIKADSVKEFKANWESLEEDVAIYTGLMLKVKQAFEKAKSEQLEASYAVWEKFDSEIPSIKAKTQKIVDELKPLQQELKNTCDLLAKIDTYNMERLIETVWKFSNLYGESKNMVEFLVNNYTKPVVKESE